MEATEGPINITEWPINLGIAISTTKNTNLIHTLVVYSCVGKAENGMEGSPAAAI